ncbi:MAG TPA: type 1 glutamine amidotransferase domain-containing protein [Vicinamibacterales bacterium]|jgi:protease I|nr:type 1 glutamine amidotransferase domain-containing protein [Vicinamibacterales bacterium]
MTQHLTGMKVAALVEHGFEQSELLEPRKALEEAGARVDIVSPVEGAVKAWHHGTWGEEVKVDQPLADAHPDDYDALLLPGGLFNPDRLRMNERAVQFVKAFTMTNRPVASICHGPWMLIEADALRDRRVTSWPSLKTDLRNAGAIWVDGEVIEDRGLVTSRKPDDIPAFNQKMIEIFADAMKLRGRQTSSTTA